jgi:hypothetical protein
MDEKIIIYSQAANPQPISPSGRNYILGLQNAPEDVIKFFRQDIVKITLGDPY